MKENAEAKIVGSKIGLEENAEKSKYIIISPDQNAGSRMWGYGLDLAVSG